MCHVAVLPVVAGAEAPNGSNPSWSSAYSSGAELVKGRHTPQQQQQLAGAMGWGAAPLAAGMGMWDNPGAAAAGGWETAPVVSPGVKEALKVVFSKDGCYAQVSSGATPPVCAACIQPPTPDPAELAQHAAMHFDVAVFGWLPLHKTIHGASSQRQHT
jgi:hypothetical protein